jgi:hypothetical protein
MKEVVLVTLAVDAETGAIDPGAPFMVNSRVPGRSHPYNLDSCRPVGLLRCGICVLVDRGCIGPM